MFSLQARQLPTPHHPSGPMTSGDGNYKTFRIDKVKYPTCAVPQATYKVYKDQKSSPSDVEFMAQVIIVDSNIYSIDKNEILSLLFKIFLRSFVQINSRSRPDENPGVLGSVSCHDGYMELMHLNDGMFGLSINARGCGISTVLAELCFLDPNINFVNHPTKKNNKQKSIRMLQKYPNELNDVIENCKNLIALTMTASPFTGAYGYFSAAKRTGYRQFLVESEAESHMHRYWTEDAESRYDSATGNIRLDEHCEGCAGNTCRGYGQKWYFCKDT